jgi:pyruvate ferredoxin oxidoreductase delta subunit
MKLTLGRVAQPGESLVNETGSWRTASRPRFLQQNCIACDVCALHCPEGCISGEEENTYYSDQRYCKGCGICAWICPKDDIEMIPEVAEDD